MNRLTFEIDTWLAKWRVYRWFMWRVFRRTYYMAVFRYAAKPISDHPQIILFKRQTDKQVDQP